MNYKITTFLLILLTTWQIINSQTQPLKKQNHVINKAIKTLVSDKDLKNASIGFLVVDAKTGEVVTEHNPSLSLMPASTQKIVTTATALEVLGKYYRFETYLEYSGTIDTVKRVLNGNIYIKGGADPTLGSKYYDKAKNYKFLNDWILAIKKNKIDFINGMIIGDASRYSYEIAPPKWTWEDIGNYYGAGANGLTVFDNLFEVHFQSPKLPGLLTKITKLDPEIPNLQIYNEVLSSNIRADHAFIFGAPYRYLQIIRGTIPKAKDDFVIKGAIPDPAYYIAWRLKQELSLSGVKTNGNTSTVRLMQLKGDTLSQKGHKIDIYKSPGLLSIINVTNKKSINLFAEHLFNEIGYKLKKEGSNGAGIDAVTEFWQYKGMNTDGFYIFDGSGLSRFNSITPEHLVFILKYMKNKSKNFETFYESLPVAGKSGTLSWVGRNTSAQGVVHAKSGSIARVRAYAGYVTTKSKRELAFSINIANYNCSDYEARKKLTEVLIAMADFNL